MHRIGRGGDEIKSLIEGARPGIFRMDGKGTDTGDIRCLQCALHSIPQKRLAHALALRTYRHGQTRQQHDRHRMPRQSLGKPFRGFLAGDLADGERVIPDNNIPREANIGVGGSGRFTHAYRSK